MMRFQKRTDTRSAPAGVVRVLAVTAGISVAGALCGGVAGATAFGIVIVMSEGFRLFTDLVGSMWFAGIVGAELGAVCAPLIAWLLLRYVPLGRALLGLTLGTILGGLAGWYLLIENTWFAPIGGALAGFVAAGVALRSCATPRLTTLVRIRPR